MRSLRNLGIGTFILICVAASAIWIHPAFLSHAQSAQSPTTPAIPRQTRAMGPYTVRGNTIFGSDGKPYYFHGVARDGLEFSCWGDGHFTPKELAYIGSGKSTATTTYWGANAVRLPLSEGFWLYGQPSTQCPAAQYQLLVKHTVDALTTLHLNVILDLQWSDAGRQSLGGGGPWAMPDADSVVFWKQVATIYKGYSNVQFELFNEPHPTSWSCWNGPCTMKNDTVYSSDCQCTKAETYQSVGLQALLNAVRGTGATNLAIVGGMNWGFDLSQVPHFGLKGSSIVYDTHPYPYNDKQPQIWDASFGNLTKYYPVISAESGEYDCGTAFMGKALSYFDAHHMGWLAWSWTMDGNVCSYPRLIQDFNGTPSQSMGVFVYQHMQSYK